jgi:hypothetical protein
MGVDPRFNSVHLDPSRRQDYRRAREALLQSRGMETVYAERHPQGAAGGAGAESAAGPSATFIRNPTGAVGGPANREVPPDLEYWLVDRDFIYPLKIGVNTVGRSSDNDVIVEDLYISRRHCAILVHHDRACELHDTASKNGTLVNGQKMRGPTALKSGDEIRICNREFVFRTRDNTLSHVVRPSGQAEAGTHTLAE